MPNYEDDAIECGWRKNGQTWSHPAYPGIAYRDALELYKHPSIDRVRRPTSVTPRDEPKPAPEPVKPPEPVVRGMSEVTVNEVIEKAKRGRPPKVIGDGS